MKISKDIRWSLIWFCTITAIGIWDALFLNKPAIKLVVTGFFNTLVISLLVIVFTLVLGWLAAMALHYSKKNKPAFVLLNFLFNLIRSIPQVIGILFGYIGVAGAVHERVHFPGNGRLHAGEDRALPKA